MRAIFIIICVIMSTLSFSQDKLSVEPVLLRISKTPLGRSLCGVFLRSCDVFYVLIVFLMFFDFGKQLEKF